MVSGGQQVLRGRSRRQMGAGGHPHPGEPHTDREGCSGWAWVREPPAASKQDWPCPGHFPTAGASVVSGSLAQPALWHRPRLPFPALLASERLPGQPRGSPTHTAAGTPAPVTGTRPTASWQHPHPWLPGPGAPLSPHVPLRSPKSARVPGCISVRPLPPPPCGPVCGPGLCHSLEGRPQALSPGACSWLASLSTSCWSHPSRAGLSLRKCWGFPEGEHLSTEVRMTRLLPSMTPWPVPHTSSAQGTQHIHHSLETHVHACRERPLSPECAAQLLCFPPPRPQNPPPGRPKGRPWVYTHFLEE